MNLFGSSRRRSNKNGEITVETYFGMPRVVVGGYYQTSAGLDAIWRDALRRAKPLAPENPRVLIVGLGGGGNVREAYRMFPEASITAIEYDPEMIVITDELKLYEPHPRPEIICADASDALKDLQATFDLILVDIFRGGECSPLLLEDEFIESLKSRLAQGGILLVNVAGSREYLAPIARHFSRADEWLSAANYMGMFSR